MNKAWLAAALSIVLIFLFSIIVFMPEHRDLNPVKEVKVTVLSGSVDVENTDSSQQESLTVGESVTLTEQEPMQREGSIPSPTPIGSNDYTQSTLQTSTLIVTAVDTANQPVASASIEIETKLGKQSYSLDEHGRIEISNLLHGDVSVHVLPSDYFPVKPADLVLMDEQHELSLRVPRKGSIHTRIVGNGFEPAANAQTELVPGMNIPDIPEADTELKDTDNQGRAAYTPVATGEYILLVTAPPYLPHRARIAARVDPATQTIQLSERSTVTVHVEDEEQEAVFAAEVTLKSMGSGQGITLIQETSQVTGDAVFQDLYPGKYFVEAMHGWYLDDGGGSQEFEITHDKQSINLTLTHREYSITGLVLDQASGTPIEGAEVVAFSEEKIKQTNLSEPLYNHIKLYFNTEPDATFTTGSDGVFRLTPMRGGTYTLGIKPRKDYVFVPFTKDWIYGGEDYNPVVLLSDHAQVDDVEITLMRSWKITGKVLLEDGEVLPDARVRVLAEYQSGKHYAYVHTYGYGEGFPHRIDVNEDGMYLVEGNSYVFGNEFQLSLNASHSIYRNAYEDTGLHVEVEPGETKTGVDLVFPAKVELKGYVKSEEGRALDDVKVVVNDIHDTGTSSYIYSDESGYYHSSFQPGEYAISVSEDGYLSQITQETLELTGDSNSKQIDFILEKGDESFEGILTDEENTPLPKRLLTLSFRSSLFYNWSQAFTDENGRFTLHPRAYPEEEIVFKISAQSDEDYDEAVYETSIRGEKNIHLIAKTFNDYGSISGFVVDQTNQPVTHFDLKLVPTQIRSYRTDYDTLYQWQPITHPNGAFSLENIPTVDGPFLVSARTQSIAPGFSEPITLHKDLPVTNIKVQIKEETFSLNGFIQSNGAAYTDATILFVPNNPVQFTSLDSQDDGYSQLNLSYPNGVTLEDGAFALDGVPVRGGHLMVRPRWDDQDHQITMVEIQTAQPQDLVDVGVIQLEKAME